MRPRLRRSRPRRFPWGRIPARLVDLPALPTSGPQSRICRLFADLYAKERTPEGRSIWVRRFKELREVSWLDWKAPSPNRHELPIRDDQLKKSLQEPFREILRCFFDEVQEKGGPGHYHLKGGDPGGLKYHLATRGVYGPDGTHALIEIDISIAIRNDTWESQVVRTARVMLSQNGKPARLVERAVIEGTDRDHLEDEGWAVHLVSGSAIKKWEAVTDRDSRDLSTPAILRAQYEGDRWIFYWLGNDGSPRVIHPLSSATERAQR